MSLQELIARDPSICHGAPCFLGTRIPVSVVLDHLAAGVSEPDLYREYPTLPDGAVSAAREFTAANPEA